MVDNEGTIVTNAHVVEGARQRQVRFDENGELIEAEVKGGDPSHRPRGAQGRPVEGASGLTPSRWATHRRRQVGDPVMAIGNPFGYSRTVTTGIVSGLQREIQAPNGFTIPDVIQTDASINPGNSGGPLLDANGRVIGINSQIATGGGQGSVGIGFAVPINTAKKLLPQLKAGETIEHAYLGVQMQRGDQPARRGPQPGIRQGRARGRGDEGQPRRQGGHPRRPHRDRARACRRAAT